MTRLDVTESAPTGLAAEPDGLSHEPTAAAAPACTPTRDVEAADAHRDTDADAASGHRMRALGKRGIGWSRVLTRGVLPGVALVLAVAAGFLKWVDGSARLSDLAGIASVQAARDTTIALLSYKHDTVDNDVAAARERLTGNFKDVYNSLTRDVVIPGAKQKQISTVATVPVAASVSGTENHAVVLVFVDQTLTMGNAAPTDTASSVRVTLDKIDGRWLISQFDPV